MGSKTAHFIPPPFTALFRAHTDVVRYLVGNGADLNQADNVGCTPTCIAAQEGQVEVVRCLAEHGAKLDQAANDGATPTCTAAYNGHPDGVRCLAGHGAQRVRPEHIMVPTHEAVVEPTQTVREREGKR